jgi:hypothetical protein
MNETYKIKELELNYINGKDLDKYILLPDNIYQLSRSVLQNYTELLIETCIIDIENKSIIINSINSFSLNDIGSSIKNSIDTISFRFYSELYNFLLKNYKETNLHLLLE